MLKILLGLGIYTFIGIIIAYLQNWRDHHEILSFKSYALNIARCGIDVVKSVCGVEPLRQNIIFGRSDMKYSTLTRDMVISAISHANGKLLENGMSISNYIWRQNDCDDYALMKSSFIKLYIKNHHSEFIGKLGIPIGVVSYIRDVDGRGHQIIQAWIDKKRTFWEPYGEDIYFKELNLTKNEKASIYFDVM